MRPPIDDHAVTMLRDLLPEFEDRYLDLADIYGEDLTPQVVFQELAELLGDILRAGSDEELTERCFRALEAIASSPRVDATELVGLCVFEQLAPIALDRARTYLGPSSERILERVEADLFYEDDDADEIAILRSERIGYPTSAGATPARR